MAAKKTGALIPATVPLGKLLFVLGAVLVGADTCCNEKCRRLLLILWNAGIAIYTVKSGFYYTARAPIAPRCGGAEAQNCTLQQYWGRG
jgi:hypothetical protein